MKIFTIALLMILFIPIGGCATGRVPQSLESNTSFVKKLEDIRVKYKLPALAAIIVDNKNVINVGATGLRAIESDQKVTINDKFHLGSNTKSMTSTLLAKLIDDGYFKWTDTIESVFPELNIHQNYKSVTLEQLLRHQGGTTSNIALSYPKLWNKFWQIQQMDSSKQKEQRALLASTVLADKPSFKIASKSNYSNTGIVLVGAAIENKLNDKYEKIMKETLFSGLNMNSCGFGAAGTPNSYDQPRGHITQKENIKSVNPGPLADNPDAIAPAGKVHCSILDWGEYIQEHLKGAQGISTFLKESSFKKLHSPIQNQIFGLGWINLKPSWAKKDNHIFHNGSNTMNYAEMWISPKKNYAIAVATNIGNQKAMEAVRKAIEMIAKDFLEK
jgi:CubicO group peptidase (beta-lactamase class C family)